MSDAEEILKAGGTAAALNAAQCGVLLCEVCQANVAIMKTPKKPTRVRDCLSIYLDVDSLPRFFGHIDISLGYSGRRHCNPEPD
jgi:hypothetical protein